MAFPNTHEQNTADPLGSYLKRVAYFEKCIHVTFFIKSSSYSSEGQIEAIFSWNFLLDYWILKGDSEEILYIKEYFLRDVSLDLEARVIFLNVSYFRTWFRAL